MSKHVRIGVFLPNGAQALDVATVDILASMSKEYLAEIPDLPSHMGDIAPSVTVSYITSPTLGELIPLTAGMTIKATHLHTSPEVAPGKLDIVVVPGPAPRSTFEDDGLKWLKAHAETEGVDILSVCTGILICAAAGIVDGKVASGPRGMQDVIKSKNPTIKLVGDDVRWAQDGNFWSSGKCSAFPIVSSTCRPFPCASSSPSPLF